MGKIEQLQRSRDGEIRSASIRTALRTTLHRPINFQYPMEDDLYEHIPAHTSSANGSRQTLSQTVVPSISKPHHQITTSSNSAPPRYPWKPFYLIAVIISIISIDSSQRYRPTFQVGPGVRWEVLLALPGPQECISWTNEKILRTRVTVFTRTMEFLLLPTVLTIQG